MGVSACAAARERASQLPWLPVARALLHRQKELEALYPEGTAVPKPPHWGGYLLRPTVVEFWQVKGWWGQW